MAVVIADAKTLKEFFQTVLDPPGHDEAYVMMMTARAQDGRMLIDRTLLTIFEYDEFYRLLRRWETPTDAYADSEGRPIYSSSRGYLIDLIPRNVTAGIVKYMSKLVDNLYRGALEDILDWKNDILSHIQSTNNEHGRLAVIQLPRSNTLRLKESVEKIREYGFRVLWVSDIGCGYHVITIPELISPLWRVEYGELCDIKEMNVLRDPWTPIPGTYFEGRPVRRVL